MLFILKRILIGMALIFCVAFVVFAGIYAVGNPVDVLISPQATQEEAAIVMKNLGLDLPMHQQFVRFLSRMVQGDFGKSFVYNEEVIPLIFYRFPATLEIAFGAILVGILIGIPAGMIAGLKPHSFVGRTIMAVSTLGFSVPGFWLALLMIMVFAVELGLLPSSGRGQTFLLWGMNVSFLTVDGLKHLILPVLTTSIFQAALITRLTVSGVRETIGMDFILFARARGLSQSRIHYVHLLKNILIPVVSVVGMNLGNLVAFATVTETVYAWPGVGKLFLDSVISLDRPVIIVYVLLVVVLFIVLNLIVDILYSLLDPRVRLGGVRA